jgi:glycosyltransferase involved in cell wall biosynthesis
MAGTIAFVLKGYPRLSESFIAQEILGLERRGLSIAIYSLRRPTDTKVSAICRRIAAPVVYLPEYLRESPALVLRALAAARRRPGFRAACAAFAEDLRRDRTRNRARRFGQALVLAYLLPPHTTQLHAHFIHTPASVARYASLLTGIPFSVSAHAKDIWTTPAWDLEEKLAGCAWAVTCTRVGQGELARLAGAHAPKVRLVYHGLDTARFAAPERARSSRDGGPGADPVGILSVGRLVEKKGYDDLVRALARLPRDLSWRFVHVGGGPDKDALAALARELGVDGRIAWMGSQPQEAVLSHYRASDVFVLASRVAKDGDREGLPNVLMEAQSQGLPCVATRTSAVPELIVAGETGLIVPPGDPDALAAALLVLARDPSLRDRLGAAGQARVVRDFPHEENLDRLKRAFCQPAAAE